jgi:hypothetical protein
MISNTTLSNNEKDISIYICKCFTGIIFNSGNPGPGSGSSNAYTGIGVQGFLTLTKI